MQLPPLRSADASYGRLLDEDGRLMDDGWRQRRAQRLLAAADRFSPDALLVETFPFGRRMLKFELLPLLERLRGRRPRARVYASVRDIIEPPRKPGRAEETVALVAAHFDTIFVHGDSRLVQLARSFPLAGQIDSRVRYTGYVLDESAAGAGEAGEDGDLVLVSAGGGPVGADLLACAVEAHALSTAGPGRWRVLAAPGLDERTVAALRARAPHGVVVERNRVDFRALLSRCRVSVSQAGYNTLVEALGAGAQVVCVPFAAAGEQEQGLRARLFEDAGLVRSLAPERLSPASLAALIDEAARDTRPPPDIAVDGARSTALALLADLEGETAGRGCIGPDWPIS